MLGPRFNPCPNRQIWPFWPVPGSCVVPKNLVLPKRPDLPVQTRKQRVVACCTTPELFSFWVIGSNVCAVSDVRTAPPCAGAATNSAGGQHFLRRSTMTWCRFTGELCLCTHFSLAETLVLVGCVIPPAPVVPASTRVSARLNRVGACTQFTPK